MDIGLPFEIFQVIGKWRADGATVPTPEPDAVPETGESDDLDFLGIPKRRKGFRMRIQDPATRARWGLFTPPVRERLETSLRHLFSDDPLSTLIPKEF